MLTEMATQLDLLAQGPNLEDWGDLLIVALMAVLWLGGALVKAISAGHKGQQQPHRQDGGASPQRRSRATWQERLARKAEEIQRAIESQRKQAEEEAQARVQGRKAPPARGPGQPSAPPGGRITIRPGSKGDSVMIYERPESQPAPERQQQAVRRREMREARKAVLAAGKQTVRPPAAGQHLDTVIPQSKPLDMERARSDTIRQSAAFQSAALIDYDDPEALKKAILHYEILGKPVALRDPSERTGVF